MDFHLELSTAAKRDLKRLPSNIQEQILFTHLLAIQANPYGVSSPLDGTLKGKRSYRFGGKPQYRIIYFIEGKHVTVTTLGTRENIYKRAKRRKSR